jgi:hypothetical protein
MPLEMGGNECKLQPKTHERVTQKPQELSNPKQRLAKRLKNAHQPINQNAHQQTNICQNMIITIKSRFMST